MKLIDFNQTLEFQNLIRKMGAERVGFSIQQWNVVAADKLLKQLSSYEGIDVSFKEITVCSDGTFEYIGTKVLVYIRDQYEGNPEYKYHLCTCKTIEDMKNNGRLERFVISTRTDGKFKINKINKHSKQVIVEGKIEGLKVCKNCLLHLKYKGYQSYSNVRSIYNDFKLSEYFDLYKSNQHIILPSNNSDNAALNDYTENWIQISSSLRDSKNWICEDCKTDYRYNKQQLHVHHINGIRSDNKFSNLRVVCKECHSKYQGHLKLVI